MDSPSDKPQQTPHPTPPTAPSRKPRKKSRSVFVRFVAALFSVLVIGGVAAMVGVGWFQHAVLKPGPNQTEVVVDIPSGMGVRAIAEELSARGVLEDPTIFFLQVRLENATRSLKAGEMIFPARVTIKDIIAILKTGKTVQYTLTVPEGLTSQQVVALIDQHPKLAGAVRAQPQEGTLMPETYSFPKGYTRQKLIDDMQDAMQAFLLQAWEQRQPDLPFETPLQAATLASIVEKETGVADERALVAGVFINRLRQGMRLQSDPTVIYGLVEGRGELGRELLRSDWKSDTPYNTYMIPALPPGPIANPGRASILAVMNPQTSKYLYFVADGSGGHAFAQTLKQHNANVARWRQFKKQRQQDRQ